ncbi:MAG: hypothetical protein HQL52_05515 [Magnetococcales bacterium]|nr:hypothetical protein [Magnetococcales bacterium]
MKSKRHLLIAAFLAMGFITTATPAKSGTLENMERERSMLITTWLAPDMTAQERRDKADESARRLASLERLVWRDKGAASASTPTVRTAFENYDLTFLVHAALEKDRLIIDHWMEQLGLSSHAIMNARSGRR